MPSTTKKTPTSSTPVDPLLPFDRGKQALELLQRVSRDGMLNATHPDYRQVKNQIDDLLTYAPMPY